MTIITRAAKGSELTHAEMDTNFKDLRDGLDPMVPKTRGVGIRVDSLGTPSFGWDDMLGLLTVDEDSVDKAPLATFYGGVKSRKFPPGKEAHTFIHVGHEYLYNSDVFIHVHWAHNSALVTGGSVTWGFETIAAKSHDQMAFSTPKVVSITQNVSTIQYRHMLAETGLSVPGGSATQFDTAIMEPDTVIMSRLFIIANNITVSSGPVPDPFAFFVDLHYQSTKVATKSRTPDFWT